MINKTIYVLLLVLASTAGAWAQAEDAPIIEANFEDLGLEVRATRATYRELKHIVTLAIINSDVCGCALPPREYDGRRSKRRRLLLAAGAATPAVAGGVLYLLHTGANTSKQAEDAPPQSEAEALD